MSGDYSGSQIGFHTQLREQTPNEPGKVKMNLRTKALDGAMPEYLGKFVKFDMRGGYTIMGVYRGVNGPHGSHVLRPCICLGDVSTPNLSQYERQEWRNWPSFLRGDIVEIQFADEKLLRQVARNFDDVKDLGEIVTDVLFE